MVQKLLPHRFKLIGLMVVIVIIAGMVITKLTVPDFVNRNRDSLKPILKSILVAGLLIIILSKEKIEDEFINHCRLKSFTFAFICSAFAGILSVFDSEPLFDSSGFQVICTQLLGYLFYFSIIKSNLLNRAK